MCDESTRGVADDLAAEGHLHIAESQLHDNDTPVLFSSVVSRPNMQPVNLKELLTIQAVSFS